MYLIDMEESLGLIKNGSCKDIMEDALKCYNAKIFRGCVIFTYYAVFLHIKESLLNIKSKLNSKVDEDLIDFISQIENGDYVPEKNQVEKLKKENIINEQVERFLSDLIYKRNQCAHANFDFIQTAEDARNCFNQAIILILQYQEVSIEAIIDKMKNSEYIFYNKSLEQQASIINKNIVFNDKTIGYFVGNFPRLYSEATPYGKRNLEIMVYHFVGNEIFLKKFFNKIKDSILLKSDPDFNKLFKIILMKNFNGIFKIVNDSDIDNFIRVLPSIISMPIDIETINEVDRLSDSIKNKYNSTSNENIKKLFSEEFLKGVDNNTKCFHEIMLDLKEVEFKRLKTAAKNLNRILPYYDFTLNEEQAFVLYVMVVLNGIMLREDKYVKICEVNYKGIVDKAKSYFDLNGSQMNLNSFLELLNLKGEKFIRYNDDIKTIMKFPHFFDIILDIERVKYYFQLVDKMCKYLRDHISLDDIDERRVYIKTFKYINENMEMFKNKELDKLEEELSSVLLENFYNR